MPTYDYKCNACGHRWDLFQSMTASPIKVCPSCGKRKAERLIGVGAAVLFKGSGFYQTDYRSDSYKKAAEAETKSSTPAETKAGEAKAADATKPAETKAAEAKPAAAPKPATAAKGRGKSAK